MAEVFYGYCFPERDGWHTPSVTLTSPGQVFNYVNLQKRLFDEVRITDSDDFLVVQALGGKVVFPPEWVEIEKKMEEGAE
jgi:hypothetical protein